MPERPSIGLVGATGAVGTVARQILRERGYDDVRLYASARSAGRTLDGVTVEEATPEALAGARVEALLFAIGAAASRELVPPAAASGTLCVDKSSAFRMEPDVPLVVPEVNGDRAHAHHGIVAVPNCSTIQLVCALKPLNDAAGLRRVRVATYQSASGAGRSAMERLRLERPDEHDLRMDWSREGDEFDEEVKLREETRKIMELPALPVHATCVRVPVLVGHLEAVWIETEEPLSPSEARDLLEAAPGVAVQDEPTPRLAAGIDDVLVGRIRADPTAENGLSLLVVGDNLRKGAALNAIQIVEHVLEPSRLVASAPRR
jgi:aspartate-semialdehyde dehydrogenase